MIAGTVLDLMVLADHVRKGPFQAVSAAIPFQGASRFAACSPSEVW
ncbi:uncharacterized protein METZ01_LOCUS249044 [marine metagenome]|uniref:Uncharacterized protein n=1 Tax=marine metagenome TaxID=408172 RepID=A0A382I975_9ZZZZ